MASAFRGANGLCEKSDGKIINVFFAKCSLYAAGFEELLSMDKNMGIF